MKIFLDTVPPIKLFVTYLTYPTLVIRQFYPSIQCLQNPNILIITGNNGCIFPHVSKISSYINPSS